MTEREEFELELVKAQVSQVLQELQDRPDRLTQMRAQTDLAIKQAGTEAIKVAIAAAVAGGIIVGAFVQVLNLLP